MFDRVRFPGEPPPSAPEEIEISESPEMIGDMTIFEDGSAGYENIEEEPAEHPFSANLAETMDEEMLRSIGHQLMSDIDDDKLSREDWEEGYRKGLNLLGMKTEEMSIPWPGSCGLFHTMVAEAVVRFQSNAIMEIFPPSGPAKTLIIGRINDEIEKQAQRVQDEFNYQLTECIEGYREDMEKLLFSLASCGSAFKKLYPNPITGKPDAQFVPAQDFILPYGAQSLAKAERYTHIFQYSKNDLRKLQVSGFYRDTPVDESTPVVSDLQEKIDEINREGMPPNREMEVTLYECHCNLDFEDEDGIGRPYVVTLDEKGTILSVYRNWEESDELKQKILWFVQYNYVPGLGAYGYGLLHLIGASAKAATSILRQLIDAGTLANLPGGLKASGLRMKGDSSPIRPGEWREADVSTMKLSEAFFPLPYKDPSGILLNLLQNVVEEGRRLGSIADIEIGDVSAQAPVGTTLAILDRAMKVMSAVQARLHASMRLEFRILRRLIRDNTPDEYEFEVDAPRAIKRSDFDDRIDVIPVSDPNAATLPQRVTQYQAAIQMSAQAPQIYNMALLHRKMLEVLGVRDADKIIPDEKDIKPLDPVSENMRMLTLQPVKAFEQQNHEAHLQAHQAFFEDPKMRATIGQNPQAQQIAAAIQAHIAEHYAFLYRIQVERELGTPLPPVGEALPGDIESNLSMAVAEACRRLLGKDQAEAAQQEAAAKAQDPALQLQMADIQVKKQAVEQKQAQAQMEAQVDLQKAQMTDKRERERMQVQQQTDMDRMIDANNQFLASLKEEREQLAAEREKWKAELVLEYDKLRSQRERSSE